MDGSEEGCSFHADRRIGGVAEWVAGGSTTDRGDDACRGAAAVSCAAADGRKKRQKGKKTKELLQQPRTEEEPGIVYQRRGSGNRVSDPIIIIDTSTKNMSLITPQKITDMFLLPASLMLHIRDAPCEQPWGSNISETCLVDPRL